MRASIARRGRPWPLALLRFFFAAQASPPASGCGLASPDVGEVWMIGRFVVHRTIEKRRFQRTAVGQRQNIQACSPSAMEKKIICARPTIFSNGT